MADVNEVKDAIMRDFMTAYRRIPRPAGQVKAAQNYAARIAQALVAAFRKHVGPDVMTDGMITPETAQALVVDPLATGWRLVAGEAAKIQTKLNEDDGYSIRSSGANPDENRLEGMVSLVSSKPYEEVEPKFYQCFDNIMRASVDYTLLKTAHIFEDVGIKAKVRRTTDAGACKWCQERAGTYDIDDEEAWARHLDCGCNIEVVAEKGRKRVRHEYTL